MSVISNSYIHIVGCFRNLAIIWQFSHQLISIFNRNKFYYKH